ncbi:aminopeptidase N [Actinomyces faecalis]|uniref:aminopeptidase N n=1 Tax=Actinomyces faecalis TaxID=2722820 RepID=UPI00155715E8|nr:aminopeptidase N [Actinomyces faecalis]
MTSQPSTSVSQAPDRLSSLTNLSRAEALWRSQVLSVQELAVVIDVTSAPDRQATGFAVHSELTLQVLTPCAGAWVDFLGEEVVSLSVDDHPVQVSWDGARVALPELDAGEHTVVVEARGRYSNSGQGLHRFHDPVDGATYLYTHFEPSDSRRAWASMDQPDLKSPFSLTVVHPSGWTVLGNGVVEESRPSRELPEAVVTRFATTLPLPGYLTALAAGPWHRVSSQWCSPLRPDSEPVELSWSCRASLAAHLDADELLEVTAQGMTLYDEAYGYPYPWGAYDSVLVPEYNLGAMENPGCVTFNEDAYLFLGPVTRAQHAGRANTILHEMCHMWFGDLVTPTWWEDTWLKESFAENQGTWAQATATRWTEAWATFALGRKAWAYAEDSRPATTHPIVATVNDVEAARQTFDGITYAKGAAVLKQLVAYLGQDVFLQAARRWFTDHAFANGDLAQFLDTLGQASGRDMDAWAQAWLRTAGPSVLTDELESDGEHVTRLTVRQEGTDLATGEPVTRPHTLVVGLYSFDGTGRLTRTHRLPLTLTTASADLPQAVGLPVPDLVTVNDEDLTYAVIRPDAASLATARTCLARLEDPLTRSLWWSSLDNLVRDGLLDPVELVSTVLAQADDGTQPATLTSLLSRARHYALVYVRPQERAEALTPLVGSTAGSQEGLSAWELLEDTEAGGDAQLVRARAWIEAAGQARALKPEDADLAVTRLRQLLDGGLRGLSVDNDLRWRILIALARNGRASAAELDQTLQADPSASGRTRHLQATSSFPQPGLKETVFARVLQDTSLSNDHLDALIQGFAVDAHQDLTASFTDRYLAELETVWATRGQETATRIVNGLFPSCGSQEDLDSVTRWLEEHPQAPAALRRLVLKGQDDLARALRCRR